MSNPKITASVGPDGRLTLEGSPDELGRVLAAMHPTQPQFQSNPLDAGPAPAPAPAPAPVVEDTPSDPNPATKSKRFYAVFRDETGTVVHTTKPKKLWSEARADAKTAAGKLGERARHVAIYDGGVIAPNRGSVMRRARTAWHNV